MRIKYNKDMLSILLTKVKYYPDWNQLGGCFTYAEVVLLVDHFGLKEYHSDCWYNYSVQHLEKGENGTTWVYFEPNKGFMKQYLGRQKHDTNIL